MGSTIKGSHQSDFLDPLSGDRRLSLRGPVFMAPPWVVGFMISSGVKLLARHAQLPAPSCHLGSPQIPIQIPTCAYLAQKPMNGLRSMNHSMKVRAKSGRITIKLITIISGLSGFGMPTMLGSRST